MPNDRRPQLEPETARATRDIDDDAAEIRYRLTALGESVLGEAERGARFRGFGPCGVD